jgi:hypothetical protein
MDQEPKGTFGPDTIRLLDTVLDQAWNSLPPSRQARTSRIVMAERLLALAAGGERDPRRLRAAAVIQTAHTSHS